MTTDRCLIYTRVSGKEQEREGMSLASQTEDCRRYAHAHGWTIVGEFTDVMKGTRDDRPHYQAMLEMARQLRAEGRPVAIVVKWLHRLGRRVLESVQRRDEFKALGIPIHSVADGGEVSDLMATIMAGVAEYEVQQLGDRVAAVWATSTGKGWFKTAPAPWGYWWRPATPSERAEGSPKSALETDTAAQPYVVELFERVAAGAPLRSLQPWLTTLPASIRGRRAMSRTTIHSTLRNPVYVSRALHGAPDVLSRQTMRWPAIVPDALWTAVQVRMDALADGPRRASGRFALTGLLRCPACGERMRGQANGSRYRCAGSDDANSTLPTCWQTANAPRVERDVFDQVAQVLEVITGSPVVQRKLKAAWREAQASDGSSTRSKHRHALETRITAATAAIDKATDLLIGGVIARDAHDRAVSRALADKDAAYDELARLRPEPLRAPLPTLELVLKKVGGWTHALHSGEIDAQRAVLGELIVRAVPHRHLDGEYHVDVTWTAIGEKLLGAVQSRHVAAA